MDHVGQKDDVMGKVALGLAVALAWVVPILAGAPAHAHAHAQLVSAQGPRQELALADKHEDDCAEARAMIRYACGSGDPWACIGAHLGSLAGGCGWQ